LPHRGENDQAAPRRRGFRFWASRLSVMVLVPLVLLVLIEAGLRIGGYGFNASPMISWDLNGRRATVDNFRFPWRFFPRQISREFDPFLFIDEKPADTYRIFVLGSSAAQGVPDGAFAFGRILEVMLRESFPRIKFEVFNAALTAVNSHAVLPIVRACVKHRADLLVVYMGNNEVVGPYGPGTVFTPFSGSAFIRFDMALRTLRLGQLMGTLTGSLTSKKESPGVWRGMEMFLGSRIPSDDPRMESVYRHFTGNLGEIGRAVGGSGTAVIFCTVAVNLRDCPPFASQHRGDLSADQKAEWERLYRRGIEKETAGDDRGALEDYRAASAIDGRFAELAFRMGRCEWRLGDFGPAKTSFLMARDADTLRFRADGTINARIREAAAGRESQGLFLADIESLLAAGSANGIPGEDLFLDHVHLNFRGNYLIARALWERVGPLLQTERKAAGGAPAAGPPGLETCAEKLAYTDWDRANIADEMLNAYIKKPPFSNQLYHAEQVARLERELAEMRARFSENAVRESEERYENAILGSPRDWWLNWKYSQLLYQGRAKERDALAHLGRVAELVPHSVRGYSGMALILQRSGDADGAIDSCLKALAIDPTKAEVENILAAAYELKGWSDQAEARYEKAIRIQPRYAAAYANLATLYAKGRRFEAAEKVCRRGLAIMPDAADLSVRLADSLDRMGRRDEAIAALRTAQSLDPRNDLVNRKLSDLLWEKIKK
jgi:tetratricopeptide (TPR) repeat protein